VLSAFTAPGSYLGEAASSALTAFQKMLLLYNIFPKKKTACTADQAEHAVFFD